MRSLIPADRSAIRLALAGWCARGSVVALRTRALVTLAEGTGLRVAECVALDVRQVLAPDSGERIRIATRSYVRSSQAKGGETGAGVFDIPEDARAALRAYLLELRRRDWLPWPPPSDWPLFLGTRLRHGRTGHARLSVRSAQHTWHALQRRAGLQTRYGFHSLRHEAATRLRRAGGDVFDVQALLRMRSVHHASRYVSRADALQRLPELARRAARL